MENFSLEKIDTSKDTGLNFLFLIAIALFFAGPIIAFGYGTPISLTIGSVFFGFSILIYFYIFQSSPATHYFQYFWLSEKGIHHAFNAEPNGRVDVIFWDEIKSVACSYDEGGWQFIVLTFRKGMDGVPLYLPMISGEHASSAVENVDRCLALRSK